MPHALSPKPPSSSSQPTCDDDEDAAAKRTAAHIPQLSQAPLPLWHTTASHYSCELGTSVASPKSSLRGRFGSSSRVNSPRKMSVASRSPSSDETAGGGRGPREHTTTTAGATPQTSVPSTPGRTLESWPPREITSWSAGGTAAASSLSDLPPPPPPRRLDVDSAAAAAAGAARGALPLLFPSNEWEEEQDPPAAAHARCKKTGGGGGTYSAAADWLVAASEEDDDSSTEARGYGCGEGVSRTSSSLSLRSPTRLAQAMPVVSVTHAGVGDSEARAHSAFLHSTNDSLVASEDGEEEDEGASTPLVFPHSTCQSNSNSSNSNSKRVEALPTRRSSATPSRFVQAGMEALRTFTEQIRTTHTGEWGTSQDPTGVRHTCGDCFVRADTASDHGTSAPSEPSRVGTPGEDARDATGVSFSLERFSPFYKLAIKELILECERRVEMAPAAVRGRQEDRFRQTVALAAAASTVVGPRGSLYRGGSCNINGGGGGEARVSTHAFDTLRRSASADLLAAPTPDLKPSAASAVGDGRPGSAVQLDSHTKGGSSRLQVPSLAIDGPLFSGKGTPMPLAHFPTAEEAARAGFFLAASSSLTSSAAARQGLGDAHPHPLLRSTTATAAAAGSTASLTTEDLSLEALLKALDYYIPYKQAAPMVFIGGLAYLSRVATRCVSDYTSITHANWYRLTVLAVLTASKMYNEQSSHRLNRFFAAASGIPLAEMKRLEIDFLYLVDFDLLLEDQDVAEWLTWMEALALRHGLFASLNHFVLGDDAEVGSTEASVRGGGGEEECERRLRVPATSAALPVSPGSPAHSHAASVPPHLAVRSTVSGDGGSLLDSSIASPVVASEQRRHRSDGAGGHSTCGGWPRSTAAVFAPTLGDDGDDADDADHDGNNDGGSQHRRLRHQGSVATPRLFSVVHGPADPPTPPTLRELSRLADTPTVARGRTEAGATAAPSPPSPSLFFSRGSRGTSTTGVASSLHRPAHTASTLPRHGTTLAPSSSACTNVLDKGQARLPFAEGPGDAIGATAAARAGSATTTTKTTTTAAAHPHATVSAGETEKASRWGVMGRMRDVLGATASLVRGQLQVLASPGSDGPAAGSAGRRAVSGVSPLAFHQPGRSPGTGDRAKKVPAAARTTSPQQQKRVTPAPETVTDEDGYYDEQGCFHWYEDEGFYDDDGYYYFYEDVGYYDDDGVYHYYEDEGYYDEAGNFYYYDDEDAEGHAYEDALVDEEDAEGHDDAFFERCRPPTRLSPPSL